MKFMGKSFRLSKAMVVRANTTFYPEIPSSGQRSELKGKPSPSLLTLLGLSYSHFLLDLLDPLHSPSLEIHDQGRVKVVPHKD